MPTILRTTVAALAALATAASLSAQVADGDVVVSSFASTTRGAGGLFVLPPRAAGTATPVTGLGVDLTGSTAQPNHGANCVAISPFDGALLVGEFADSGVTIDLHVIQLNGTAVRSDVTIPVGVTETFGGIHQIVALPNGDAAIAVSGLQRRPPLNGTGLAIVSRSGTVTPIAVQGAPTNTVHALAADATFTTLYFESLTPTGLSYTIHAVPLAGGTARQIAAVEFSPAFGIDSRGAVMTPRSQPPGIDAIDPVTGTASSRGDLPEVPNGIAVEAATDDVFVVMNGHGAHPGVFRLDGAGGLHQLTAQLPGIGSGIAVSRNPSVYGVSTPGSADRRWRVAPAPGGVPQIGNQHFGLQLETHGGASTPGLLVASPRASLWTSIGVTVLLDANSLILVGTMPASGRFPLPIPNAAPPGAAFHFQSFHVDFGAPNALAASNGQRIVLLR